MSISQHLNITPHSDDTDSLQDMYLQCVAMSDFQSLKKREKKEKEKQGIKCNKYPHPHKHLF